MNVGFDALLETILNIFSNINSDQYRQVQFRVTICNNLGIKSYKRFCVNLCLNFHHDHNCFVQIYLMSDHCLSRRQGS